MSRQSVNLPELKLSLNQISDIITLMKKNMSDWQNIISKDNEFKYEFSEIEYLATKLSDDIQRLGQKVEFRFDYNK